MGNRTCPVLGCGAKTEGGAVRQVNFCEIHRKLAAFIRDDEAVKKYEARTGRQLSGSKFTEAVNDVVREVARQGYKVVGT